MCCVFFMFFDFDIFSKAEHDLDYSSSSDISAQDVEVDSASDVA